MTPPDLCIEGPSPSRYETVLPAGATPIAVPALILSGHLDRGVPTAMSRQLLTVFPKAMFLVVAGAGHVTVWSACDTWSAAKAG